MYTYTYIYILYIYIYIIISFVGLWFEAYIGVLGLGFEVLARVTLNLRQCRLWPWGFRQRGL